MSLLLTRVQRTLIVATVAALLLAVAAFTQSAQAASAAKRAERAVKVAAVHTYGIGTKIKVNCAHWRGSYFCAFAASPRGTKAVYMRRAKVSSRMRVRFYGKTICVGAGCKK